jgi:hypothetical protein
MRNGGDEENKLEPETFNLLLETLEDWSDILNADEEVTQMLESFKKSALDEGDFCASEATAEAFLPSEWEPSP